MAIAEAAERFGPDQPRMVNGPFQTHRGVEPFLAHDCAGEANTTLHYDPSLLCIDGDRPVPSRGSDVRIEGFAQVSWFATEVVREAITAARVPDVTRNKTMAAFRTWP